MKKIAILLAVILVFGVCTACGNTQSSGELAYTISLNSIELNGIYTGAIVNKLPHGHGTFTYSDEEMSLSYTTEWENGIPTGVGKMKYEGFELEYNNAILEGTYTGNCKNGLPHGTGKYEANTPNSYFYYNGSWSQGMMSGIGNIETNRFQIAVDEDTIQNGEYIGEVYDGIAEGKGVFSAINENGVAYNYIGEWSDGVFNGHGIRRWDSNDKYLEKGRFVDGEFFPTPVEFYEAKGTLYEHEYVLSNNAKVFLEEHPDMFLNNEVIDENIEYEEKFVYKIFEKNPEDYGTKLLAIDNLQVHQIIEYNAWGADHTRMIGVDSSWNVYSIEFYGHLEGIVEGSRVKVTVLPLDSFTYPNIENVSIWAMACAGVCIH